MLWLWILLAVLGVLTVADLAAAWFLIFKYMWRCPAFDARRRLRALGPDWESVVTQANEGLDWVEAQPLEAVSTISEAGFALHGTLLPSPTPTTNVAICIHGFRSSWRMDYGASARFIQGCGCHVLFPDNRAHGDSGGKFIGFGCSDRRDIISWCRYVEERFGKDCRILLVGISMGGAAVVSAAGDPDLPYSVRGVISDCPFSSGWDEMAYQMKQMFRLPPFPILHTANLILRLFAGYSLRRRRPIDMVSGIKIPLLLIHGRADSFVPTYMSEQLYSAAICDKRLLLIDGAGHGVSYCVAPGIYQEAVRELIERAGMTVPIK